MVADRLAWILLAGIVVAALVGGSHLASGTGRRAAERKGEAMETATFGAGCFWGVEDAFRQVEGVVETAVGYEGGTTPGPSYAEVCRGNTGHTEVVQVMYDPARVSYEELLNVFWDIHDPTHKSKAQYKSVVFYHTEQQRQAAEAARARREAESGGAVATEIIPASTFYRAEDYHQQYYEKRGGGGSCLM